MRYHDAIGLDIGSYSVKAVRIKQKAGFVHVADVDWTPLPSLHEDRQKLISSFIAKKGWAGLPCTVGLPDENIILRSIVIDREDPRTITEVIHVELDQFKNISDHNPLTTYTIQKENEGKRSALIAFGRADIIESYIETAYQAGLDVINVIPEATGCLNSFTRLSGKIKECLINIQIGASHTTVMVLKHNTVLFAKHITSGLQQTLSDSKDDPACSEAWWGNVVDAIEEYTSSFPEPELQPQLILSTGCPLAKQTLLKKIEKKTGIRTLPLSHYISNSGIDDIDRFATAYGLALDAISRPGARLSLKPDPMKERLALQLQRPYLIATGAVVNLFIAIIAGLAYLKLNGVESVAEAKNAELNMLQKKADELEIKRQKIRTLRNSNAPFISAVHNARIIRIAMDAIAKSKNENDWIVSISDSLSYFGENTELKIRDGFQLLIVEGYTIADDMSSVRNMINSLKQYAGILEVDLLSDDRLREDETRDNRWNSMKGRLFALQITLSTP